MDCGAAEAIRAIALEGSLYLLHGLWGLPLLGLTDVGAGGTRTSGSREPPGCRCTSGTPA